LGIKAGFGFSIGAKADAFGTVDRHRDTLGVWVSSGRGNIFYTELWSLTSGSGVSMCDLKARDRRVLGL
jgi:hypothetical protein